MKQPKEKKSWWMSLEKTPHPTKQCIGMVELPGGQDDAGLMESDLIYFFELLIENAHEDLTDKEIKECFKQAQKGIAGIAPSGILMLKGD
jgi:hypothetical protein